MHSIYEVKTYRDFIAGELDRMGRGGRAWLAEKLNVRASFVSLVLTGRQDFNPEHILRIAELLRLDDEARKFLLLLLERDRAGSVQLRKFYENELDELKTRQSDIQKRIRGETFQVDEERLAEFYASWATIAIHMLLRNPDFQDVGILAEKLGLPREHVMESLRTLERFGFAENKKGRWQSLKPRFHFGRNTSAVRLNHLNWRQRAMRAIEVGTPENDLHYSSVISLDAQAVDRMRKLILEMIANSESIIEQAGDREVYALTLDWFPVVNSRRPG